MKDCGRKNFSAAKNRATRGRRCSAWCGEDGWRGVESIAHKVFDRRVMEERMSSDTVIAMDELDLWIWLGQQRL
uniref:Uncharacterized protein n=1 Tax=Oryza sativa subsp. japonica TaxID=39947 RepID=Q9FWF9_ORYSJ|nr:hypothetical protein [Oryza sativa Japonica Group]